MLYSKIKIQHTFNFLMNLSNTQSVKAGVGTCAWLYIGRIFSDTPTEILAKNVKFPTTTEGCLFAENGTSFPVIELDPLPEPGQDGYVENSGLLSFYNISYHYIGFIGLTTCATTGKQSDKKNSGSSK